MDLADKRRYIRIFFPVDLTIRGTITIPENLDSKLDVRIMNLSEGGIGFTLNKNAYRKIYRGENLTLNEVSGYEPIHFLNNIELIIRWVLDEKDLEHYGLGGEFVDPNKELIQKIGIFVDYWVNTRHVSKKNK
ncbi:MAG: PilZ domain-containing protein [Desulfobacterales bacterium]|nr:PilZ domain-containing protein [Desulfobacterales bacterium]